MSKGDRLAMASELLFTEAALLDKRRWDEWLALFAPDCEFWVPSWVEDERLGQDPDREVSLIYYSSRSGLEDRVWRITSGTSVASAPLPRTAHAVSNIQVIQDGYGFMEVEAVWSTDVFSLSKQSSQRFFGRYEYRLVLVEGAWRIGRKKVILLNDYLPAVLDIYCI